MIDYARMIDASRNTPEHAASAPVFYETAKTRARSRRLTKRKKQASLTKARDRKSTNRRRRSTIGKAASMAKRKKSGRLTKAEIKKAGGIKQAWRARGRKIGMRVSKRKKSRGRKKSAFSRINTPRGRKSAKRVAAGKKAAATRRRNKRGGKSGSRRRTKRAMSMRIPRRARKVYVVAAEKRKRKSRSGSKRKSRSGSKRKSRSGGKRKSAKRVAAGKKAAATRRRNKVLRRGRKSSSTRIHRGRKSALQKQLESEGYAYESRRSWRSRRRRRHGAMENPLSGVELFVGSLFGLTGFAIGDLTDRFIATHALTLKSAATTTTPALYADNPPTTGSYAGLFNPTAITSPMNLPRWANAVGAPALIFTVAHFVKSPVARSSMQFFAFGYGVRGVGKGIMDLMAKVTTSFGLGQRLYDGEMRAQVLKANSGSNQAAALANLPAAGLGQPTRQLAAAPCAGGCGCAKCKQTAAPTPSGVGWPSQPREITSQSTQTQPQAPVSATAPPRQPPPPPNAPPAVPIRQQSFLTGAAAHPSYKRWGDYNL
jgi:hypothetical protein